MRGAARGGAVSGWRSGRRSLGQLWGKMGCFERPLGLEPASTGQCVRMWCSLGMMRVPPGNDGRPQGQRAGMASSAPFVHCHLCVQNSLETRELPCLLGRAAARSRCKAPFFPLDTHPDLLPSICSDSFASCSGFPPCFFLILPCSLAEAEVGQGLRLVRSWIVLVRYLQ